MNVGEIVIITFLGIILGLFLGVIIVRILIWLRKRKLKHLDKIVLEQKPRGLQIKGKDYKFLGPPKEDMEIFKEQLEKQKPKPKENHALKSEPLTDGKKEELGDSPSKTSSEVSPPPDIPVSLDEIKEEGVEVIKKRDINEVFEEEILTEAPEEDDYLDLTK